jgi:hypothetical protein
MLREKYRPKLFENRVLREKNRPKAFENRVLKENTGRRCLRIGC